MQLSTHAMVLFLLIFGTPSFIFTIEIVFSVSGSFSSFCVAYSIICPPQTFAFGPHYIVDVLPLFYIFYILYFYTFSILFSILLLLCLFSIVVVGTLCRARCGRHSAHKGEEMGIG